jgi:Kdo2-lipid IVA lauroyltransferase/acyltransferase
MVNPNATAPPIPLWMRLASRLPLHLLYGLAAGMVFVVHRVLGLRLSVIRSNIAACFPDLDAVAVERVVAGHYRQVGEMFAEVIKSASLSASSMIDRVTIQNLGLAQAWLEQGRPLLLVAAHQANWEWVLQALAMQLGYPLDVGYKPIRSAWAEFAMNALRRRFGAHLVPAKELLPDLLKRRHIVRGIAMLADQEPTTSEHQHWLTFLGRETAFYMGAEQMARAARYPALFVALRRLRRGYYEIEFTPLLAPGERLEPGEFTKRYARLVEAEIRAAPSDWTWGHRRWKLKRGLYARDEAA